MDDFSKFLNGLIEHTKASFKTKDILKDKELAEAWGNHLLGLKGPTSIVKPLTDEEKFFRTLFYSFYEVFTSYQKLLNIEVYINYYSLRGSKVTKAEYLRYHIENYLQELYIFKERIKSFLTKFGRLYRGFLQHQEVLNMTKPFFRKVSISLDGPIKARGVHVHKNRYTDDDLDRLESLELIALEGGADLKIFQILYSEHYKKVRTKWKKLIRENNKAIRVLLNQIFEQIYQFVFDDSQHLQYPKR